MLLRARTTLEVSFTAWGTWRYKTSIFRSLIYFFSSFNDQEIVALSGAHALGRCHVDRSGFDGPWTFSPTTVTNDYFQLLFDEKWVWKKWSGPKQLEDKKTKTLMMLPWVNFRIKAGIDVEPYFSLHIYSTDYVLVQDKSFKKFAKAYAESQDLWFQEYVSINLFS